MYESFFQLHSKPFNLLPDPEFLFPSRSHQQARTYLEYGIQEKAGFILLTGEVGSGKTTLIRDLLHRQHSHVVLAKVFNTRVDGRELLSLVNADFGLDARGKEKPELLHDLTGFLIDQFAAGNQAVLIIDEAQNLPMGALEEIRLLSNLESDHHKLLQIILVGQPELKSKLAAQCLVQLRQRISVSCHIKPLSREETAEYILHRLEKAGNRQAAEFAPAALDRIHALTRGIPRLVNILCDYLLLSAYAAQTRQIGEQFVNDLAQELDFENLYWGGAKAAAADGRKPAGSVASARNSLIRLAGIIKRMQQRMDSLEAIQVNAQPAWQSDILDRLEALERRMGLADQPAVAAAEAQVSPVARPDAGADALADAPPTAAPGGDADAEADVLDLGAYQLTEDAVEPVGQAEDSAAAAAPAEGGKKSEKKPGLFSALFGGK